MSDCPIHPALAPNVTATARTDDFQEQHLLSQYNQKMAAREPAAAKTLAQQLIQLNPTQARHYIRLGQCYIDLKEQEQALATYQQALLLTHQRPLTEIITTIQQRLVAALPFSPKPAAQNNPHTLRPKPTHPPTQVLQSHYCLIGGRINLGMLVHCQSNQKYLTKIQRNSVSARKESFFYSQLTPLFPALKQAAPVFIDVVQFDGIQYLTLELIEFSARENSFQQICQLSRQIGSVPYDESIHLFSQPQTAPKITARSQSAVRFFASIHTKAGNEHLFQSLLAYCRSQHYQPKIYRLINQLYHGILNKQLFGHLHPDKHYSLLHGDFKKENIGLSNKTNQLLAYDWGSFFMGPHFIDLAFYAYLSRTPLEEIKAKYLYRHALSAIEMGYFWLAYFVFHIIALSPLSNKNLIEKRLRQYIEPAFRASKKLLELP